MNSLTSDLKNARERLIGEYKALETQVNEIKGTLADIDLKINKIDNENIGSIERVFITRQLQEEINHVSEGIKNIQETAMNPQSHSTQPAIIEIAAPAPPPIPESAPILQNVVPPIPAPLIPEAAPILLPNEAPPIPAPLIPLTESAPGAPPVPGVPLPPTAPSAPGVPPVPGVPLPPTAPPVPGAPLSPTAPPVSGPKTSIAQTGWVTLNDKKVRSEVKSNYGYKSIINDLVRIAPKTSKKPEAKGDKKVKVVTISNEEKVSEIMAKVIEEQGIQLGESETIKNIVDSKSINPTVLVKRLEQSFQKVGSDDKYTVYKHLDTNDVIYIPNMVDMELEPQDQTQSKEYMKVFKKLFPSPYNSKYDKLLEEYARLAVAFYRTNKNISVIGDKRDKKLTNSIIGNLYKDLKHMSKKKEDHIPMIFDKDSDPYKLFKSIKPNFDSASKVKATAKEDVKNIAKDNDKKNIARLSEHLYLTIQHQIGDKSANFHNYLYKVSSVFEQYKNDPTEVRIYDMDTVIAEFNRTVSDLDIKIYETMKNDNSLKNLVIKIMTNAKPDKPEDEITPEEALRVYNWYSTTIYPAVVTIAELPDMIGKRLAKTEIQDDGSTVFTHKVAILGGSFQFVFIIVFAIIVLFIVFRFRRRKRRNSPRNIFNDKDPMAYPNPMQYILKEHSYTDDFQTNAPRDYEIASIKY